MKQVNKSNVYFRLFLIYRKVYRKALLVAALIIIHFSLQAQDLHLEGSWSGNIQITGEANTFAIDLVFNNNDLVSLSDELNKASWLRNAKIVSKKDLRSLTIICTQNSEFGVHSEIYQIYPVTADSATVSWKRQCLITPAIKN